MQILETKDLIFLIVKTQASLIFYWTVWTPSGHCTDSGPLFLPGPASGTSLMISALCITHTKQIELGNPDHKLCRPEAHLMCPHRVILQDKAVHITVNNLVLKRVLNFKA